MHTSLTSTLGGSRFLGVIDILPTKAAAARSIDVELDGVRRDMSVRAPDDVVDGAGAPNRLAGGGPRSRESKLSKQGFKLIAS